MGDHHQQTKTITAQLARTAGHVTSIKRMVEEGRPCPDILIQLSAVRAAIERAARLVLEDHLDSCLRHAQTGEMTDQEWDHLKRALDSFIS
ncbi:MAG: metal-sensing transcriptional repressor [Ktedonobacteraceae bacterium]|nr:metal-sensing transcriptional repressor [Ktedonobacteraceae bacterium]